MLNSLNRRLIKLEKRRPRQGPAQMVDASRLDPEVLALLLGVGLEQMNLDQLELLQSDLRRLK